MSDIEVYEPRARIACAVEACGSPRYCRGFCTMHYQRYRRTGDALMTITRTPRGPTRRPLAERFWEKVDKSGECWLWTGAAHARGYGRINEGGDGRQLATHRVAYELLVGPIPTGMELDHLCVNPPCVNPAHLEPVTHRENLIRGHARRRVAT